VVKCCLNYPDKSRKIKQEICYGLKTFVPKALNSSCAEQAFQAMTVFLLSFA